MDAQQFGDICNALLSMFRDKGFVTIEDVEISTRRHGRLEVSEFHDVLLELNNAGVVVEGVEESSLARFSSDRFGAAAGGSIGPTPPLAASVSALSSRQIYFRDVGRFKGLDRAGEIALAQRRIRRQNRVGRLLSRTVPVADIFLDQLRAALDGSLPMGEVVTDPPRPTVPRHMAKPETFGDRIERLAVAKRAVMAAIARRERDPLSSRQEILDCRSRLSEAVLLAHPTVSFWQMAVERLTDVTARLRLLRDRCRLYDLMPRESGIGSGRRVVPFYYDDITYLSAILQSVQRVEVVLNRIRCDFVTANLKLSSKLARRWHRPGSSMNIEDLEQAGNIGLFKAVDRFDPSRGCKFSTYATWWIRQAISRFDLENGRDIRVPVHLRELARRIREMELEFAENSGRFPSSEELATKLGSTVSEIRRARFAPAHLLSLEHPMDEEGDEVLGSRIPDVAVVDPEDELCRSELRTAVRTALARTLTPEEEQVVRRRFGMEPRSDLPCVDVARGRERELVASAIRKLADENADVLRAFVAPPA